MSLIDKMKDTRRGGAAIHIGTVVEIHLNTSGVPLFKVMDPSGAIYYPCTTLSMVAGNDGRFSLSAPRIGSTVALFENTAAVGRNYFIMGGMIHPNDLCAVSVDGVDTAIDVDQTRESGQNVALDEGTYYINQNYAGTHVHDLHLQNLNSYLNMSDVHGVSISGTPRVSIEIPDDPSENVIRFAAGGVAGNRVLNAHSFLNRLFRHIEELHTKIDALEAAINVINPNLVVALNGVATLANTPAASGVAPNPLLATAIVDNGTQVANAALDLANAPAPQNTKDVRKACENDKNPFIIIP